MTKTRLPTDVHLRFTTLTSVPDYTLYTPEMRGGKAHVAIESNYSENNSYCIGFGDSAVADLEGGPLESTSGNVITGSASWNIEDYRIAYPGFLHAKGDQPHRLVR